KPLPRGIPGGIFGILGVVAAAALIISVAVTVFIVYRRQQKGRSDTDNDLIDLPPSHKPAPPPPKRKQEMKSHLTAEDIQVVHLDNMKEPEEEIQKLPPQPPYYDMAATEPTPHSDKMTVEEASLKATMIQGGCVEVPKGELCLWGSIGLPTSQHARDWEDVHTEHGERGREGWRMPRQMGDLSAERAGA
ncbi:Hypothetical predicted protein, partial [Podarcis lilfordi]